MTCFRACLNVTLEWYITFLTKQWCKALNGGHGISERGARGDCLVILPYYPSLSLQSRLLAKRMRLKWNWIWIFSHQGFKFRR